MRRKTFKGCVRKLVRRGMGKKKAIQECKTKFEQ